MILLTENELELLRFKIGQHFRKYLGCTHNLPSYGREAIKAIYLSGYKIVRKDDRVDGSREPSEELVGQIQNKAPQDERNGTTGMARQINMFAHISFVAGVQATGEKAEEVTRVQSKTTSGDRV